MEMMPDVVRQVWREGFAPLFGTESLQRLLDALESDDPRLLQGATSNPPPLDGVRDWPIEGCCAVSFTGWDEHHVTVEQVETHFARSCFDADQRLGEPAGCRHFLNWYDDTPRDEMRTAMILELKHELETRKATDSCLSGRN